MVSFLRLFGIRPYVFFRLCEDLRAPGEIMEPVQLHFFRRWLYGQRDRLTGRKRDWALTKKANIWMDINNIEKKPKAGSTTMAELASQGATVAFQVPTHWGGWELAVEEAGSSSTLSRALQLLARGPVANRAPSQSKAEER